MLVIRNLHTSWWGSLHMQLRNWLHWNLLWNPNKLLRIESVSQWHLHKQIIWLRVQVLTLIEYFTLFSLNLNTFFICLSCYPGYTGGLCQIDIDECLSSPCQNGGTCSQPYPNMYTCRCPRNYRGPQCLQFIDLCIGNSCVNGGTCVPNVLQNSYGCQCLPGTTGTFCESTINVCLSSPCGNNGVCIQPAINNYQW